MILRILMHVLQAFFLFMAFGNFQYFFKVSKRASVLLAAIIFAAAAIISFLFTSWWALGIGFILTVVLGKVAGSEPSPLQITLDCSDPATKKLNEEYLQTKGRMSNVDVFESLWTSRREWHASETMNTPKERRSLSALVMFRDGEVRNLVDLVIVGLAANSFYLELDPMEQGMVKAAVREQMSSLGIELELITGNLLVRNLNEDLLNN